MFADVEAKFTSIERLDHFLKELKPEEEFSTKNNEQLIKQWPENGDIEFEKVSVYIVVMSAKVMILTSSFFFKRAGKKIISVNKYY